MAMAPAGNTLGVESKVRVLPRTSRGVVRRLPDASHHTCIRLTETGYRRIGEALALAQALEADVRVADVVACATLNLCQSLRLMLRKRGIDPNVVLAAHRAKRAAGSAPAPAPAEFDAVAEWRPRAYRDGRKRGGKRAGTGPDCGQSVDKSGSRSE